jgi:hypothetical protein
LDQFNKYYFYTYVYDEWVKQEGGDVHGLQKTGTETEEII